MLFTTQSRLEESDVEQSFCFEGLTTQGQAEDSARSVLIGLTVFRNSQGLGLKGKGNIQWRKDES